MKAVKKTVEKIITDVKRNGDRALFKYAKKFDKFNLKYSNLKVTKKEISLSYKKVDKSFLVAIKRASSEIKRYQKKALTQLLKGKIALYRPIENIGVYVPGGRYAYPSTLLATVIPAKVAGVGRITMVSPPNNLTPEVLVTADIVGVDEIYRIVAEAIDNLPEKERLVISLYYNDDLIMKEIGAILDITESRVSQIHTKAILRLRSKLVNVITL